MTDSLHDTLTAEHHAREQLEHDTHDISEKLDEIKWMYPRISDTMLMISGSGLDLTGIRGTTDRIPGGDALAMLGPWSPGYDEPDDLPHPGQIVREWADRWRQATRAPDPISAKWATHLAVLRSNTEWFIRQDRNGDFRKDIRALWWRLARLTGNAPDNEHETLQRQLADVANDLPDHARLTLTEIDKTWPDRNLSQRIRTARSKENARARTEHREPAHPFNPDENRRYLVKDIRNHYPETRPMGTLCATL